MRRIYVRICLFICSCLEFAFRTRLAAAAATRTPSASTTGQTRPKQQAGKHQVSAPPPLRHPPSPVRFGRQSLIKRPASKIYILPLCSQTHVQLVQWHTLHLYTVALSVVVLPWFISSTIPFNSIWLRTMFRNGVELPISLIQIRACRFDSMDWADSFNPGWDCICMWSHNPSNKVIYRISGAINSGINGEWRVP